MSIIRGDAGDKIRSAFVLIADPYFVLKNGRYMQMNWYEINEECKQRFVLSL
jgi:hypothetical protein